MKHLFLDTNVIIDVLANREPFSDVSSKLLDYGDKGKTRIFTFQLYHIQIFITSCASM